jgi:hypothetical protein
MRGEHVLLAAGLVMAAGCYSYAPTRLDSLQPGQAVRVRLSPEEAERLEPMRRSDTRLMEGTVVDASGNGVTVNTAVTRLDPMSGTRALFQTLDVQPSGIIEVELRERDNLKTGATIGGIAVAVAVGLVAALSGDATSEDPPGTPPIEEAWLPVFLRLAFPF